MMWNTPNRRIDSFIGLRGAPCARAVRLHPGPCVRQAPWSHRFTGWTAIRRMSSSDRGTSGFLRIGEESRILDWHGIY